MPLFRRAARAPAHPRHVEDDWTVAEGQMDGAPVILRLDAAMAGAAGHPDYTIQMGVAVPLLDPDTGGLPSPDEGERLGALEDEIDRLVGDNAVMVAVVTTGVMREFVLYTGSGDWIARFHEDLQAVAGDHEVQVTAQRDPEWDVYSALAG